MIILPPSLELFLAVLAAGLILWGLVNGVRYVRARRRRAIIQEVQRQLARTARTVPVRVGRLTGPGRSCPVCAHAADLVVTNRGDILCEQCFTNASLS